MGMGTGVAVAVVVLSAPLHVLRPSDGFDVAVLNLLDVDAHNQRRRLIGAVAGRLWVRDGADAADNVALADRTRSSARGEPRRSRRMSAVGSWARQGGGEAYMQPTWNSWPHGSFITRLTPSTYSSRHTTHSLQPLHRRWKARPMFCDGISLARRLGTCVAGDPRGNVVFTFSSPPLRAARKDDERDGNAELIGGVTVAWYVLTGRRSTRLLGARHRRRRMRVRISSRVYTTVSVTSGDTTSTSSVSKNGDDVIVVGVRVIQRPLRCAAGGRGFFARDLAPAGIAAAAAVAIGLTAGVVVAVVMVVVVGTIRCSSPAGLSGIRAPESWRRSPAGTSGRDGGAAWPTRGADDGFGASDFGGDGPATACWRGNCGSSVVRSAAVVCDVNTDGMETLLVSPRCGVQYRVVIAREGHGGGAGVERENDYLWRTS